MNSQPAGSRSRYSLAILPLLLLLCAGVWIVIAITRSRPKLSPDEAGRLVDVKNQAIGYLENEEVAKRSNMTLPRGYAEAERRFVEIIESAPDQPLGPRNLAICRYLQLDAFKTEPAKVEQAIGLMRKAEHDSAPSLWLAAKFERLMAQRTDYDMPEEQRRRIQNAVDLLRQAAKSSPKNVVVRYELFDLVSQLGEGQLKDELYPRAVNELKTAYKQNPQNLHLLLNWIKEQAQRKDPSIGDSLDAAMNVLSPLREVIQRKPGARDVVTMLERAQTASADGNWDEAVRITSRLFNAVKSQDAARSDYNKVHPHPLDFVIQDFDAEFYKTYLPSKGLDAIAAAVTLKRLPDDFQPMPMNDVRDVLLADFDRDKKLDLIVLRRGALEVFGRTDGGGQWDVTCKTDLPVGMTGLLGADLDRDTKESLRPNEAAESQADIDLVIYGDSGAAVLRNRLDVESGKRTLEVVEQSEAFDALKDVTAALLVDVDHDADLDLVVASADGLSIWSSLGDMTFEDNSRWSILPPEGTPITALAAVDWDRDVDVDVIAGGPELSRLGLLENLRHGRLRWQTLDDFAASTGKAADLVVAETDGNVSWDLVTAGNNGIVVARTVTPRPGVVKQLDARKYSTQSQRGVDVWDYDNDGIRDLIAWREKQFRVFRGEPDGKFAESDLRAQFEHDVVDCKTGDLDDDGDLDVAVATSGGVVLFDNVGGNKNRWLAVRAVGIDDNKGKANNLGIGSLMEVKAGAVYQAQVVTGQQTHFGLGARDRADVLRIVWTNGAPQHIIRPKTDQAIVEIMTPKGSCPFLYTWNGERFVFYTDCLWASPIGLQTAEGKLAPSRPWEYLKISGDKLKPTDGRYTLQITEELWEAAYFDAVRLIAVDHPYDVEVFSNEKVGGPDIAAFKVHTVRRPRRPIAARDKHGADVLSKIERRDGDYLKAFDQQIYQGLVDEHFVELDLGPLADPRQVVLFLTGWIYPTDTSINVHLSQHPQRSGPEFPSVWMPDKDGRWQRVIDYMGFPGGKTKTIAVDLSGKFLCDDHRVRIVTSAEIYWDEIFFTMNEEPAGVKLTPLDLASADLHFRGFSRRVKSDPFAPLTWLYDDLTTRPLWPPMQGRFTRFGNVTELLTAEDDRLAILGAGDELTLNFAAADVPPPGWRRDFLLYSVGWDKDADLNTLYGQTVEPLPRGKMRSYPPAPDASTQDTARRRRYLDEYQTREQNPARFWKMVREYQPATTRTSSPTASGSQQKRGFAKH